MVAVVDQMRNFKESRDCLQMYNNSELIERFRYQQKSWIIFGAQTFDYITNCGHRKNTAVQRGMT